MTIKISIPDVGQNLHPQITVLGVGGSGGNAVNNMINSNLEAVEFLIANNCHFLRRIISSFSLLFSVFINLISLIEFIVVKAIRAGNDIIFEIGFIISIPSVFILFIK